MRNLQAPANPCNARIITRNVSQARGEAKLYKNLPLLLVAFLAALAFLSEAAMEHWSGVYLRNTLALPALVGASGVAAYHASMAAGRLVFAGIISHFGNRPTLRAAGRLTIALRRAGFEVAVFERTTELREVGAGLLLAANHDPSAPFLSGVTPFGIGEVGRVASAAHA